MPTAQDVFYFQAQTGIWKIKKSAIPSNFYTYTLPFKSLARVQLAVDAATVGSGGLEYPADFLAWLEANDQGDK